MDVKWVFVFLALAWLLISYLIEISVRNKIQIHKTSYVNGFERRLNHLEELTIASSEPLEINLSAGSETPFFLLFHKGFNEDVKAMAYSKPLPQGLGNPDKKYYCLELNYLPSTHLTVYGNKVNVSLLANTYLPPRVNPSFMVLRYNPAALEINSILKNNYWILNIFGLGILFTLFMILSLVLG